MVPACEISKTEKLNGNAIGSICGDDFHGAPDGCHGVDVHGPGKGLYMCLSLGRILPVAVSHPNN